MNNSALKHQDGGFDIRVGNSLICVKSSVDAVRAIRTTILQLAGALAANPGTDGCLLLVDCEVSINRLRLEWDAINAVLKPALLARLMICSERDGTYQGVPHDPPTHLKAALREATAQALECRSNRVDYSFVVDKILIYRLLTGAGPVTSEGLGRTAGCSYPTVARAVSKLGGLVERTSDRRMSLSHFPDAQFARLLAVSEMARSTTRFADSSGQPRSVEAHVRRLEKLNTPNLAIGGVLGAQHYEPELDIVGAPRLDLSIHCPNGRPNLDFIQSLDPALRREHDPIKPANVVVHVVRHADSLFEPRKGGLNWADQLECLFDLHDAKLKSQAVQFLGTLQRKTRAIS